MFVTILTIIYSAIALFIMVRFAREKAPKVAKWANKTLLKINEKSSLSANNWEKADKEEQQMSELHTEMRA